MLTSRSYRLNMIMDDFLGASFAGKKILVAGGTGTIGIQVVRLLVDLEAKVEVVSVDPPEYAKRLFDERVSFTRSDLTILENCIEATRGKDYVFNLVGIKGSTGIGEAKVASYLVPMLWFQTNLMEAAFRNKVERYLFVSSICAYPQSAIAKSEETVWDGMPKQNDRIPGLAKRMGEIQAEAYLLEHGWDAVRLVRPSNVYGPYDDFNPATAQVIPALIARMCGGENPLKVWGDGSAIRDFIYSEDVAHWMLVALLTAPACFPINIGGGQGVTIRRLAEMIAQYIPDPPVIEWDATKPAGDPKRLLSTKRAEEYLGYHVITDLAEGIRKTIEWHLENRQSPSRGRETLRDN